MEFPFMQIFKQWDPLTGNPPGYCTNEFEEIIRRAKKVLKKRTSAEIINAQNELDNAYQKIFYDGLFEFEEGQSMDFITLQNDLRKIRNSPNTTLSKEKGRFAWSEYYATLALAFTGQIAISDYNKDARIKLLSLSLEELEQEYNRHAIQNLDAAITMLEMAKDNLTTSTKASDAAHREKNKIKDEFREYREKRIKEGIKEHIKTAALEFHSNITPKRQKLILRSTKKKSNPKNKIKNILNFYYRVTAPNQ